MFLVGKADPMRLERCGWLRLIQRRYAFFAKCKPQVGLESPWEEGYNKESVIRHLGWAKEWKKATDRQRGTPSSHCFERDGLRFIWMREAPVWSFPHHFRRKPTWCCSTGGTCR